MIAETLAVLGGLSLIGVSLRWNWWRLAKAGIPVLMYHKIGIAPKESQQKSLWVTPERFNWQLNYLKAQGYTAVTFADLKNNSLPVKPVILTFDDGYLNAYTDALPILKRHSMRGVFYVVYEAIGRENFWHDSQKEQRIPMMNLENIKTMMASGMEMGSHALTHRRLAAMPLEEAKKEIVESKQSLEKLLNTEMLSFAFPYGNGEDVAEIVKISFDAGYRWVLGIHGGIWRVNDSQARPMPRVFVRGDDTKLDFLLQLRSGRSRL